MKRFMCFAALTLFVAVAPLAGCSSDTASPEEEGTVDPAAMMDAAATPEDEAP